MSLTQRGRRERERERKFTNTDVEAVFNKKKEVSWENKQQEWKKIVNDNVEFDGGWDAASVARSTNAVTFYCQPNKTMNIMMCPR